MTHDISFSILIPAYNAAATIQKLVHEIQRKSNPLAVIVVDDGSEDETAPLAEAAGAIVVQHQRNRGKGAALKTGFDKILQHYPCLYVLCMDADLQHTVDDIPKFLASATQNIHDLIIGNRLSHMREMPYHRRLSNYLTSLIVSIISGQRIPDSQCGFRLIRRKLLETVSLQENGFQLESEMILRAAQQHFKIGSVPIATVYRNESSSIRNVYDTLRFVRLVVLFLLSEKKWFSRKNVNK